MTAPTLTCQCGEQVPAWTRYHWLDDGSGHYVVEPVNVVWAPDGVSDGPSTAHEPPPAPDEPRVIVLPWDVLEQCNHRLVPRANGKGLTLSSAYRKALKAAKRAVGVQAQAQGWEALTGPVERSLCIYPPDRRRRDGTNLEKLIDDALAGTKELPGVIEDDQQIVAWRGTVMPPDKDDPRAVIEIRRMAEQRRSA